jgi:signal transduction histidine kinase
MKQVIELGDLYSTIDIDSAIEYAKQGVEMARTFRNPEWEFYSLSVLARALSERDIPQSMQVCYQWLQLAEKLHNNRQKAACYQQTGLLHLYLGNGWLYIDYLRKAKIIYAELDDRGGVAACDSEIGQTFLGFVPDSARYYLTLSLKDSATRLSGFSSYFFGRLESADNPEKAREYFKESLARFAASNNLRGISLASRWFSIFYQSQGQMDSAIIIAGNGLLAAQQNKFLRGVMYNSEQLSLIYEKIQQPDSAYKYLKIKVAAQENLLSSVKMNQIQTVIIAEQQRAQALEKEKISYRNRIKLYTALAIAATLMLFAVFFYRSRRRIKASLDSLKATQQQLIQSEKMASLGELTAGIAHEIQNPLNFVNNFSELNKELIAEMNEEIQKGNFEEVKAIAKDVTENEQKINHHGKRADAIVKGMLQHSRSSSGIKEPTDINALAEEYLRLAYHGLRAKDKSFNASMKTDFDPAVGKIDIVPQDIGRVILNLITNAFYVVDEKKKQGKAPFDPTVTVSTRKNNGKVEIKVKDNGNGIPPKVLDKIFQPFFTTKPTGQGTGLGLSLSYDIMKAHGGELKVHTIEGEGTEFTMVLPG